MRTVGKRTEQNITFHATAENLRIGTKFNDEMLRAAGSVKLFPKGVYHYKTHQEANDQWLIHTVKEVVRRNTK
jgi:hypothetical protein